MGWPCQTTKESDLLIAVAVMAALVTHPPARTRHEQAMANCQKRACKRRVWLKHHPWRVLRRYQVSTTCYAQGSTTASGGPVYFGEVANNFLAWGTKIRFDRPILGRRSFVVEDHIGSGSEMDVYYPDNGVCNDFGRQERWFSVMGR